VPDDFVDRIGRLIETRRALVEAPSIPTPRPKFWASLRWAN